jgi:hypothetical protein
MPKQISSRRAEQASGVTKTVWRQHRMIHLQMQPSLRAFFFGLQGNFASLEKFPERTSRVEHILVPHQEK